MADSHKHDIEILNGLITTTIDSVDGYERSAENAEGSEFESMFRQFAQDRRQVVAQLQDHVRQHGGEPNDDGSLTAGLHRRFEDLREAFGGGDKAVIDEVERGEDHIKAKFQAALKDDELSPDCRAIIEQAFESVRTGHDTISQIKHSLQAV